MNIYPAIDLSAGHCVRLYQGDFKQKTDYSADPHAVVLEFEQQGAEFLHLIDLDGARKGTMQQLELIAQITQKTKLKVQAGGGIKTTEQIAQLLSQGVNRVVIGSVAILSPATVLGWIKQFGADKIVLALDVRIDTIEGPLLALHGWRSTHNQTLWQFLSEYKNAEITHVLCTDISRDGTLQGTNTELYQQCHQRFPSIQFQASGGISHLQDVKILKDTGVSGAIIGTALYEHKFTVREAILEANK